MQHEESRALSLPLSLSLFIFLASYLSICLSLIFLVSLLLCILLSASRVFACSLAIVYPVWTEMYLSDVAMVQMLRRSP